jgi:hypothetical protein
MASQGTSPPDYIWDAKRLADFLGMSVAWVRRRRKEIPRCPGIARFRVNTRSPEFREWLKSTIGEYGDDVDTTKATE